MGMDIIIGKDTIWGTSSGIFDCIIEGTRRFFKDSEQGCLKEIYTPFDEEGQDFIALNRVDTKCFNLFYVCCKQAMEEFPVSEQGKIIPAGGMPNILWNWSEVLRMMREDPRYREQQQA